MTAEEYLRAKYGAYRGHPAWRELEDAFKAGAEVGNRTGVITDPAEIRRVFEIDEADYPPPDSGFAKL